MKTLEFALRDDQIKLLNETCPVSGKSSGIGKRAIEVLKLYFLENDPGSKFRVEVDDADLEITDSTGAVSKIEVKGTNDKDIAWAKLKVSGEPSYRALINGMPVYRVCGVTGKNIKIYILHFHEDFDLVPEPRWRFKPTQMIR